MRTPESRLPVTAAVRVLREHDVAFTHHRYQYEAGGGTAVPARELGVDEHAVVETPVMQDDARRPLVALMQGDVGLPPAELVRLLNPVLVDVATEGAP